MRYLDSIMRVAAGAVSNSSGIRLNRNTSIREYLESNTGMEMAVTSSQGTVVISFMLHALSGVQCLFTSWTPGFRVAWIEVSAAGDLYGWHTINSAGNSSGRISLATGLQANRIYNLAIRTVTGTQDVYLDGSLIYTSNVSSIGFVNSVLTLGARKFSSSADPATSGGQLTGATNNPYHNHANATYYEVYSSLYTTRNHTVFRVLGNEGRGVTPLRCHVPVVWRNVWSFESSRLSADNYLPIVGNNGMRLVQTSFLEPQYGRRFGSLVL